ncbi:MAG: holo-[acyl-carrier-protein] synthase [Proteobacteria bacterium]|nr:holo-[acyl-carrier-protein] synthase [Pseudomonadota bacterium]
MIVGIGCDLCKIDRIERLYLRYGQRFVGRLLSPEERQGEVMTPAFMAKRFAAKEAVVKAMGTAFRHGLFLKDVQVLRTQSGQPEVVLSSRARAFVPQHAVVHLSLADEGGFALAYALIEAPRHD